MQDNESKEQNEELLAYDLYLVSNHDFLKQDTTNLVDFKIDNYVWMFPVRKLLHKNRVLDYIIENSPNAVLLYPDPLCTASSSNSSKRYLASVLQDGAIVHKNILLEYNFTDKLKHIAVYILNSCINLRDQFLDKKDYINLIEAALKHIDYKIVREIPFILREKKEKLQQLNEEYACLENYQYAISHTQEKVIQHNRISNKIRVLLFCISVFGIWVGIGVGIKGLLNHENKKEIAGGFSTTLACFILYCSLLCFEKDCLKSKKRGIPIDQDAKADAIAVLEKYSFPLQAVIVSEQAGEKLAFRDLTGLSPEITKIVSVIENARELEIDKLSQVKYVDQEISAVFEQLYALPKDCGNIVIEYLFCDPLFAETYRSERKSSIVL